MLVIGPWLIGYRGYCERYSALEFVNIAVHAILIFSCAVYVAIYRRRIGWVMAPLLLVAIPSAAFILNAQSGYPRMAGDICLVAY
ncbi:hypothetical protein ABAC402_04390 [Asticcacaulis sp. AC402]|nr:hypothetical protein ABAC402_04390 [Asticcacaulis sp. AC402]